MNSLFFNMSTQSSYLTMYLFTLRLVQQLTKDAHFLRDGLCIDYRDTDLRFTEILPGMVRTEFALNRFQGDAARAKEFYDSRPANLEPEAVANTILWAMEQPPEVNISSLVVQPTRNKG